MHCVAALAACVAGLAATRDGVGHGSRNSVRYDAAWEPETACINKWNY